MIVIDGSSRRTKVMSGKVESCHELECMSKADFSMTIQFLPE